MLRKIYALQLSYDVSDAEKQQAEKALLCFEHSLKSLYQATRHLDKMAIPFKDHPDIKPEEIVEYRSSLRQFRDKVIENFTAFKVDSFRCIEALQIFTSDTQTLKLINLFTSSVEEIENKVNEFSSLFDNLEAQTFIQDLNKKIDELKASCKELKEIIDERIIEHLKTNIIGKNWVSSIGDQLQVSIEQQTPILIDLFKQRQEQLHNIKNKKDI